MEAHISKWWLIQSNKHNNEGLIKKDTKIEGAVVDDATISMNKSEA